MAQTNKKNGTAAVQALSLSDLNLTDTQFPEVGFSVWVRSLVQNWRQGTVGCKARGDVNYTNKKPWKQKGTGRARAGSARSPLWRGGGVTFGPQPRVRSLKVNKKNKQQVMQAFFAHFAKNGNIVVADWQLENEKPSTKAVVTMLNNVQLQDKKVGLLLHFEDMVHAVAARNIPQVQVLFFDDINAYDLATVDSLVVLKKDVETFKEVVNQWN